MSSVASPSSRRVLVDVLGRPSSRLHALATDAALVVAGIAVVSLLAKVSFFIGPIPITGQTLGVILVAAALGARRGTIAMVGYMLAGLAGLPVFAGVVAGPAYVLMPSFGFILGFIPAAFLAGYIAERAWDRNPALAFLGFVGASIVPFLVGVPYMALILSAVMGEQLSVLGILNAGVIPFIVPGLVKAAAAALLVPGVWALVRAVDKRR